MLVFIQKTFLRLVNIIETEAVSFFAFAVVPIFYLVHFMDLCIRLRSDNNVDKTTQNINNHPKQAE